MSKPAVTILIPTYNRAEYLPECLDSLYNQTIPPAQVIVINDGSAEDISRILAPYRNQIEFIETPNMGKSAALNAAMPRVCGNYVWIFDDDDVALPDALERFVRPLEQNPDCGFSYSTYYYSRSRPEDGRVVADTERHIEEIKDDEFLICLMEGNFLCGAGIFVRTSCYGEVGPFREDLIRSQDYEMAMRLARKFRGVRVDGPTFHYRQHEGMRGSSSDRFVVTKRAAKWREYDAKFFRDLRLELDLREYLPGGSSRTALGPTDARCAYLERMTIMVSKGLYEEMVEDLKLALAAVPEGVPLSSVEVGVLRRAIRYTWPGDEIYTQPKCLGAVRVLSTGPMGREVRAELGRALYWRVLDACKHRKFRHALEAARASFKLLGFSGTARLALRRLRPPL
jgi:glycosyltransferase involved in cell wall biosynthesis